MAWAEGSDMSTQGWARLRRRWLRFALVAPGIVAGLLGVTYAVERVQLARHRAGTSVRLAAPDPFLAVDGPGLTRPPAHRADAAGLRDDEPVIGVEVAGVPRAYVVGAMSSRTTHVVNDLIANVPVTVAYCDLTRCTRVYTDPGGSRPLDFRVGGLYSMEGTEMVLNLRGDYYFHRSGRSVRAGAGPGDIPYSRIEPLMTTWGEWVRRHPTTDVFVGDRPPGSE